MNDLPSFDGLSAMEAFEKEMAAKNADADGVAGAMARATPVLHAMRRVMEGEARRGINAQTYSMVAVNIAVHLLAPAIIKLAREEYLEQHPEAENSNKEVELDINGWVNGAGDVMVQALRQMFESNNFIQVTMPNEPTVSN